MHADNTDNCATLALEESSLPKRLKWLLVGTFLLAYMLAAAVGIQVNQSQRASHNLAAKLLAQGYAQRVQERLQTALVSTYVLASVVKQAGGHVPNFDDVAAELITLFPSVSALQLAPDGVIRQIYPLAGNEAAMGHDLLADRARNREAVTAVTMQRLTLAGPFNLIQGGVGAVGRLPIFLVNQRNESYFWGFATALVKLPNLLDSAGIAGLTKGGYSYEFWRLDPDTEQRHVFARSGDQPLVAPVEYVITVYNGRWILSLAPTGGWISPYDYLKTFGYSFVAAVIVTLLQYVGITVFLRSRN